MAEGFIEKKEGTTPEEVAESYIYALLSRSLIQVTRAEIDGEVITFRIHDLLRDIIISKFAEENVIMSSSNEEEVALSDRVRRLCIYHDKGEMVPKPESCSSRLCSFYVFGMPGQSVTSSAITSFAGLHLLRVLSFDNVYMDNFPKQLTSLLHLRYLNLFDLEVRHLPSSIAKLINLETLIIEDTFISELPVEICKLRRLRFLSVSRHLEERASEFHNYDGAILPRGVGSLRFLQVLRVVDSESGVVGELGKLTQLRILEVIKLRIEDGHDLCTSIQKMRHLKYLKVRSVEEDEEINLHFQSHPPLTLQEIVLYGHLKEIPHWIYILQDLHILRLGWSGLKDDPLKALSSLPNLVVLNIIFNAYDGEELYVKQGGYPRLRELSLKNIKGLKMVMLEKGAMPNPSLCLACLHSSVYIASFISILAYLLEYCDGQKIQQI